jgi:NAD(P)-dependent dehydrogenase (short-subunit alcohol dehydrogenase family)
MNANSIDLSGRTAVVTGGARGVGLACARRILASGCWVSLWDRDATALAQAAATLAAPGKVGTVTVDVADEAAVASAASATQADTGAAGCANASALNLRSLSEVLRTLVGRSPRLPPTPMTRSRHSLD